MTISTSELLALLNEFISENQLRLSQHTFIASERHKDVKECLMHLEGIVGRNEENIKKLTNPPLIPDKRVLGKKLADSLSQLEQYLYSTFKDACEVAFDYVAKFFKDRSFVLPRVCVKVIAGDQLVVLFRRPELQIQSLNISTDGNTAFEKIAAGADYFICNDIPESVENGGYQNVRLIKEKVLEFNKSDFRNSFLYDDEIDDASRAWRECWKEIVVVEGNSQRTMQPPLDSCYKSILVIPMSLETGKLDEAFVSHFNISTESGRAIFGFVSFDHRHVDFFDETLDVAFGYILADILSLYLIQQLTYTQYSSIYYQAATLLSHLGH
ncbi:MAG: hypothetical protein KME15_08255 [Drouetiella hepatica Uher 2000/2452]|jgi:hypothetical protein|uniref:Uncharacterized protein n=1 Tax=Drouetiella hepatica Uher 2000/2452 TaxID=904376 RepID=A0A951QB91_9CYAN|nr:hypothetical protein [Drouetiella hepatica Uher 2000/2452]